MRKSLVILLIPCTVVGLAAAMISFLPMRISGRVISSTPGLSVSDALVVVESGNSSEYVDLENVRLIWAYQPDGTRNVEIKPGQKMPSPFEKFSLDPGSIRQ